MENATARVNGDKPLRLSAGCPSPARIGGERSSAFDRLERALGREFAERLLWALAGPHAT